MLVCGYMGHFLSKYVKHTVPHRSPLPHIMYNIICPQLWSHRHRLRHHCDSVLFIFPLTRAQLHDGVLQDRDGDFFPIVWFCLMSPVSVSPLLGGLLALLAGRS